MLQNLSRFILYKFMGWKINVTIPHPDKYIICLAPHTSNYDFFIGQLYANAEGIKSHFLMKKEWFFWPLGILFRKLGGIPVWRDEQRSMTDILAERANSEDVFHLCVTPEGTRSYNAEWKKGFYYIALKAQIPILLYGLDFEKKLIQCTQSIMPTGNVDEDMTQIKQYFKDFKGKHPEKFTIG